MSTPQANSTQGEALALGALRYMAGCAHGIRLRGRLPVEFEPYFRTVATGDAENGLVLDIEYHRISEFPEVDELWVGEGDGESTSSRMALFRVQKGLGLKVASLGCGVFHIRQSRISIGWLAPDDGAAHYFFNYALPLWLESRGIPVLHGSAVCFGQRAVGFVGESGAGKSTLCNALVRLGADFVADDGLAVTEDGKGEWYCHSGPPLCRLWPSALLRQGKVDIDELPRVHEGFEKRLLPLPALESGKLDDPLPLDTVYVLERHAGGSNKIEITPCKGSESVVKLVEVSLAYAPIVALGWAGARLRRLGRLAEGVRVKRLRYPNGEGYWEAVRDAIADDLARRGGN